MPSSSSRSSTLRVVAGILIGGAPKLATIFAVGPEDAVHHVSDEVLEGFSNMQTLVTTSLSTSADAFECHTREKRATIDAIEADIQVESGYLQRAIAAGWRVEVCGGKCFQSDHRGSSFRNFSVCSVK
ncbi:hypothetical protein BGW80DRAFT_1455970 [Lactifluus volemus]|nr:hypothetical protein BGW80DRAFT_1455970 [Lactifluus volemus]